MSDNSDDANDDVECTAEFIDGSYDTRTCGCPDCRDAEDEEIQHQIEAGYIDEADI